MKGWRKECNVEKMDMNGPCVKTEVSLCHRTVVFFWDVNNMEVNFFVFGKMERSERKLIQVLLWKC